MDWCAYHVSNGKANLGLCSLVVYPLGLVVFVPIFEFYYFLSEVLPLFA